MFMLWLEWFSREKKIKAVWKRKGRWFLDKSSWGERGHNPKHNQQDFPLIGVGHTEVSSISVYWCTHIY